MKNDLKVQDVLDFNTRHDVAAKYGKNTGKLLELVVRDGGIIYYVYGTNDAKNFPLRHENTFVCSTPDVVVAVHNYNKTLPLL